MGGTINSGGSVLINAQASDAGLLTLNSGNVNVIGGTITANNHVVISADEDINVVASTYNELDFHSTSKSGFGGLSKKAAGAVEEKTLLNRAGIEATSGNVNLLSGNNIALIAADVTAGGNINMEAVDQLLIGAGEAVSKSASWSKSSGLFSGGNIYSAKEAKAGESVTSGEGSVLNAGGRITGNSGSAKIIGSDLHGETGGVQLLTDIGSIEVLASKSTSQSYSYEKSMTVGLGDLVEGLSGNGDLIKNQDGRLTAKIADATYDEVETKTNVTTMTGSNITSGSGNIHLQSADSILIEGSNLQVGKDREGEREGDVNLVAVNNVTVREATDTLDTEIKETHGKAELSVVVQHQAAEVVKAVIAVDEAKDQLEQAKKDYKKYERDLENLNNTLASLESDYANKVPGVNYADILELREIVSDMKGDENWYVAGVGLAAANLAAKTTALVQQTAAAAQSTATWGFNAGLQLDIEASKTNTTLNETTAVASNISGNNVRIQTGALDENGKLISDGTSTTIQGSHIDADNKISISTGELNILASRDTREYSSETEQGHITAQMTVYGASGGASINADFSRSKAGESSTTINNSTLGADKISITTTGDTNIRGGNVHADSELTASIGGDLNVESLQDRHRTKNNSVGVSAGMSFGGTEASGQKTNADGSANHRQGLSDVGGASGLNGGLNASNGMSITRETVLSSLTSGGTANINVAGNTQITGALIASIDENGNDLGQLTLNTGSLSFTDLTNIHQSNQTSGSISTNIAYSNNSHYDADKSLATLGSGNINVGGVQLELNGELTDAGKADGSPLDRLNRDTTNLSKDLWSVERTEGNIDLQIDHRFFSKEGRAEIGQQFSEFGDNIQIVAQNVPVPTGGNVVENAVGEFLNKLGEWTGGVLPSDANAGGLVAQIPVLFGNNDIQAGAIQVRPANDEYVLANPDAFMPASELPYFNSLDAEGKAKLEGVMVSRNFVEINSESATYQNHTNGILNNLPQALVNAMEQTDSGKVTSHYNPTHGGIPDLLESLIDKTFGNGFIQTGVASQTGEFVKEVVTARAEIDRGSNFIGHSQGSLLMNAGLNTLDKSDFSGITYSSDQNIPTFFINGAPVQAGTMEKTVEKLEFTFSGSAANPNDSVAELLGRNRGTYIPLLNQGSADPISIPDSLYNGLKNLPKLGDDKYPKCDANQKQTNDLSPHSTYDCKINCGDKP